MTSSYFFLQGLSGTSHAHEVRKLLELPDLEQAIFIVSYVRSEGVQMILDLLERHRGRVKIAAGVDNGVTTYQGLKLLHDAIGDGLHTVETGRGNLIFHPKVFFATSPGQTRMLTSSANLTAGGLHRNIEAGHLLTIEHLCECQRGQSRQIRAEVESLFERFPENVQSVTDEHLLEIMRQDGRLVDEIPDSRPPSLYPKVKVPRPATPFVPPMRLKRPKLEIAPATPQWKLMWQSRPLSRSDLSIKMKGRYPSGNLPLSRGRLPRSVDFRRYFREEVFDQLDWTEGSPLSEVATASFELRIEDTFIGIHDLRLRHWHKRSSARPHEPLTYLIWGSFKPYVSDARFTRWTLGLYRDEANKESFLLQILPRPIRVPVTRSDAGR